jgi:predicted GNAT family acetyltransferase
MHLVVELDPHRFKQRVSSFLAMEPGKNQLIYDLTQRIESFSDVPTDRLMWMIEDDVGKLNGVAIRTDHKRSLILSVMPAQALALVADDAAKIDYLDGVIAPESVAEEFHQLWVRLGRSPLKIRMRLRLYELVHVIEPRRVSGYSRLANVEDLELLSRWSLAFSEEALPSEVGGIEAHRKSMSKAINEGREYVWCDDEQVVAMTVWTGRNQLGTKITGVYTPQDKRGRGYASNLVAEVSRQILEAGAPRVFIYTDLSNPTSNSIYQRLGYREVCDLIHYGA